jgi:protein-disulfide isomerase
MQNKNFLIPVSIIIIGVIFAGGIVLSNYRKEVEEIDEPEHEIVDIKPVSMSDHILGNPDAKVTIIEFSDFECPYCQQFHTTMNRIMDEYGQTGQVAWVYRHFPIVDIHENAYGAALASECAASIGKKTGNSNAFWDYADNIFSEFPVDLSLENLVYQATILDIDELEFRSCLENTRFSDDVDSDINDGLELMKITDDFATPYNLIISNTGLQTRISGSASYSDMKNIIDAMLQS